MGEEEKKIEIENEEGLAKYLAKLLILQYWGDTPEKKWSYIEEGKKEGKLVPYTREAPIHVFFKVYSDVIRVTIESREDVSEFDIPKGQFKFSTDEDEFRKNPNIIYYVCTESFRFTYPQAWAIAYRNTKKLKKVYGEEKYFIIPYAFATRYRRYAYVFIFPKNLLLNYANRIFSEISRLLQEEKETEVEEEGTSEEITVEEALAGWTEGVPTAVGGETVEEIIEKAEERKEEVEREIEQKIRDLNLSWAKIITFTNPSEYLGSSRKRKGHVEEISFSTNIDPERIRRLRARFYEILRRVAFRTDMGWILFRKVERENLKRVSDLVGELNNLMRTKRTVYILDVFIPKNYIKEKIEENIYRKRARIEELEQKLREIDAETEKKVVRRLKSDLKELREEVKRLEEELKYY